MCDSTCETAYGFEATSLKSLFSYLRGRTFLR